MGSACFFFLPRVISLSITFPLILDAFQRFDLFLQLYTLVTGGIVLIIMNLFHKHLATVFIAVLASFAASGEFNITDGTSTVNVTYFEITTHGTYAKSTCSPEEFLCLNGNCVDQEVVCDGSNDCGDWSDEEFCNRSDCYSWQFNCTNGVCVDRSVLCDSINDCGDWSDEKNFCDGRSSCPRGQFSCKDGSGCFDARYLCNGIEHCTDGSDESDCRIITRYQCLPGMFICKSGFCIRAASVCNGIRECSDGSDELNCGIRNKCPLGTFACSNGRCVSASDVCDGYNDCGDRSDETNCRITTTARPACPLREFTCWNGRCINFNWVCDGYEDCTDGSDELRCGAHLKAGGVIGIIVACSVLITVVIIAVVCLRNWKQEKRTGTVFSVQPLSAGISLQQLPQRLQPTPNAQPATTPSTVTQQQGNFHSEGSHGIPQTEVQQQSNLYPSLPQQMYPVIPQNSAS